MGICSMKRKRGICCALTRQLLFCLICCLPLLSGFAKADGTLVVYPQVREPFAALYRDYLAGIQAVMPGETREYAINGAGVEMLARDLESNPPEVIIALGNKSVGIADSLNDEVPLVGLVAEPGYEETLAGGVLMKPSAQVYLDNLVAIYRHLKEIFVVYNPDVDQPLLDEARLLAESKGISLTALEAHTMREAASEYRKLLSSAPAYSAIWLLPDHGFLDSAMLSTILDVAWERRLIVFSSNPLFVKHGALFAVYPDNRAVGMTVARIAQESAAGKRQPLQALSDVRLAVNERTLNHLGIRLPADVRERIDLMLPGR